jgi:hypothetical protein
MATFQVEQHYCKEWFEQGKKLGQLWVLWRQSKERLDGNITVQPILNETEKELNILRRNVHAKFYSKSQLHLVSVQINDLEWKLTQLQRF